MRLQSFSIVLFFLVSFTASSQDCKEKLGDSIFCKTYVKEWTNAFKKRFDLTTYFVTFDKDKLKKVYDEFSDTTYVRIYFTIPSDTGMQLPGAVLIPNSMSNCQTDLTQKVLTAEKENAVGYLGKLKWETKKEIGYWKSIADSLASLPNADSLATVYAYNYTWDHIMEACHNADDNLTVAFGISNVDVDTEGNMIHMYLTEGLQKLSDRLFLDFSSPCPKMCGNLAEE